MSNARYTIYAAQAVFDKRLTPTDKLVLSALGTYANGEGWCYPNQTTLAERLGVTRQTISGAIKKLVEAGYVETEVRTAAGRGKVGYNYRVKLDIARQDVVAEARTTEPDIGAARHRPPPTSAPADVGAEPTPLSAQDEFPSNARTYPTERPQLVLTASAAPPAKKRRAARKYSPEFETFWLQWPAGRRKLSDKQKASDRFEDGVARFGLEPVLAAARNYLAAPNVRKENFRYCRLAEVFLNGGLEAAVEAVTGAIDEPKQEVWSASAGAWVQA